MWCGVSVCGMHVCAHACISPLFNEKNLQMFGGQAFYALISSDVMPS